MSTSRRAFSTAGLRIWRAKSEDRAIKKEFEATGGRFVVHTSASELFPAAWLTGPVPRAFPERNWRGAGQVLTSSGLVEDNIPEDQSLVLNTPRGLVVLTGCGHAGIVNGNPSEALRLLNEAEKVRIPELLHIKASEDGNLVVAFFRG